MAVMATLVILLPAVGVGFLLFALLERVFGSRRMAFRLLAVGVMLELIGIVIWIWLLCRLVQMGRIID